jgi:carbon storage regulator
MLVLTRRISEEIVIAGNIRVMVVAIKGQRVRLGITAPRAVPVVRLELDAECSAGTAAPTAGRNGKSQERRHRVSRRHER